MKRSRTAGWQPSPEFEREQQRWAATNDFISGVLLFEGRRPGAGFEMVAAFDPEVAARRRQKITPSRIREVTAFLEEVAMGMERLQ